MLQSTDGSIRISRIRLLGKNINVYETNESIKVECLVNCERQFEHVRFMMIVFNKEGVRLGMTESHDFSLPKGESKTNFMFSPEVLPDGAYYVELNIVERNSLGGYDKYEGICEAFSFHIENQVKLVSGKSWNSAIWGNAFYKPIEIL